LEKTGWLKEWTELNLRGNQIWDEWKLALKKLRDDADEKRIGCVIIFY
jgi:hypothetical protein